MTPVKGPKKRTATEDVVAAAVAIADREGAEALTIRAVAAAIGLTPMAIYRHVRDKDDLLDRVVDAVASGIGDVEATGTWREKVVALLRGCREVLLAHPGVASLAVSRPTPVPGVARFFDRLIEAFEEGGFDGVEAVRALDTTLMFVFGSVLWQIPRSHTERGRLIGVAQADPDRNRHIVEYRVELARRDPDEYFSHGLETILTGLEVRRSQGGRRQSGR
ncbi:MAG: TetR/AcrR family transcriptional regulator [Actinomycetota bacterium]|nr:TetR/AcrR family transcriptional regulator [Actinomycetota bacterium]